jgi:hypothetical protein
MASFCDYDANWWQSCRRLDRPSPITVTLFKWFCGIIAR